MRRESPDAIDEAEAAWGDAQGRWRGRRNKREAKCLTYQRTCCWAAIAAVPWRSSSRCKNDSPIGIYLLDVSHSSRNVAYQGISINVRLAKPQAVKVCASGNRFNRPRSNGRSQECLASCLVVDHADFVIEGVCDVHISRRVKRYSEHVEELARGW